MPFIPHTESEVREMLEAIGVSSIEDLFDEIPADLRGDGLAGVSSGLNEMEVARIMHERAAADGQPLNFMGAGAYEHHIPAAVWELTTRGEFYSAYTPYQAEASQGTLQVVYEFQTMMAHLTGLDASNASMYDGASALAEAVLMAVRANRKSKSKRVLVPDTVPPVYRRVVETIVGNQGIVLESLPMEPKGGFLDPASLPAEPGDFAGLVIPQPNYFGVLEEVDTLTDWAHDNGGLAIGLVNPIALAVLTPPGEWGRDGADIACGEGQPLGAPLSSGGPYFGFMTCKQAYVRQLPGRIVGRTIDADGRDGFTLTLQAREQHIRRSKATSNICTNQGLLATAATIYMSIMGPDGLERVAASSHANTRSLMEALTRVGDVEPVFHRPFFHEAVIRTDVPAKRLLEALAAEGILGGVALGDDYPQLGEAILVCATETRTSADIERYSEVLGRILPTLRG
ncbi:MAG: aminomethyl-transferring glycine dehydrogenase subunit GcvPA [Pseudomonadota bacterium]